MKVNDKLLDIKKKRFENDVKKYAKNIRVSAPRIEFCDCPEFTGNEVAHIHSDYKKICISERILCEMTFEEIDETASHEVEHIRDKQPEDNPIHSRIFYERLEETRLKYWKPEHPGIVITRGNEKVTKPTGKSKPFKPDKISCNYYQGCDKTIGLEQCALCKRFFCEDHILPSETSIGVERIDQKFSSKNHPCPEYSVLPDSKKREFITYFIALKNYKKDLENWKKENKEIEQENQILEKEWKKECEQWKEGCSVLWQKHYLNTTKWKEECKRIEKKYMEEKQRLEKEHKKDLKNWEEKCKRIKEKNKKNLKNWEEECKKSIFGFLKKLLSINKPKVLELPKKPLKEEPVIPELPKKPEINLPQKPEQPNYLEPKSKPEFDVVSYYFK